MLTGNVYSRLRALDPLLLQRGDKTQLYFKTMVLAAMDGYF